jgi:hypothetical protein
MPDNVQDAQIVETPRQATAEEAKAVEAAKQEAPKPGPAHEIRQAQALLAGGLFPGQMAPAIVAAFSKLESIAVKIEKDAADEAEYKARQKA